jgi:CDP-glucose 4,6-dehydratase
MFSGVFEGKKVLVTGHTGFKGAWLSIWLHKLGASVVGFSDRIPTQPSLFVEAKVNELIDHRLGDVRDFGAVVATIEDVRPDFLIHLAAQSIVSLSYDNPVDTISTNVLGTANVLNALRLSELKCVAIIVTSDKCYFNQEWHWGYRESDQLGGKDIYSGSKAAAELVFHSFFSSFFGSNDCPLRLASGRAGNVIGGGDWAKDRIVVDCMRNWSIGRKVEIRNPYATRPWQHVLEPISGYLTLAANLASSRQSSGESFNFGPTVGQNRTVIDLIETLGKRWKSKGRDVQVCIQEANSFQEARLLKLNCDKALAKLGWAPNLDYYECVDFVGDWYFDFYSCRKNVRKMTLRQIEQYEDIAVRRSMVWTR